MLLDRTDDEDDLTLPSSATRRVYLFLRVPFPLLNRLPSIWIRRHHTRSYRIITSGVCNVILRVNYKKRVEL